MRPQYRRALAALAAGWSCLHAGLAAQAPVNWEADDRIIIGPFAQVAAVSADAWRVHAATLGGIITWDPSARRWDPPLTIEDGYPARERPTALLALRGEQSLVLGTALGTLWRVDPLSRRFEPLAQVPGAVQRMLPGELGDISVQTARGWFRVSRGSAFAEPLVGAPANARHGDDARLAALRARVGLDARMRRWPITDITPGQRTDEYYAATNGGGLVRIDALTHEVQPIPYGLASQGVRAIALIDGELWFGGDGTAGGGANLAASDTALQRWQWPGTPADDLPRGAVAAVAPFRGHVWFAARDGLFRHDRERRTWTRLGTHEGLPGNDVAVLLPADSVLWIGTTRGACAWLGEACSATVLPGVEITALASCRGALWLGTASGLYRALPGEPARPVEPVSLRTDRVQALACARDTLVVAMPRELHLFAGAGWSGPVPLARRGTLRALAVAGDALWVAGDGGAARRDAVTGEWTYYIVPNDVPATPVWSILPAAPHLWLATPAGAVRLDLRRH